MGLLVEAMPKLSTVGYLTSRRFWEDPRGAAAREAAKRAGIALSPAMLVNFDDTEYQRVFRSMEQDRADAFMISDEPEHSSYRPTIVELAAKGRIPAIYPFRDYVEVGGLMAYSIDLEHVVFFRNRDSQRGGFLIQTRCWVMGASMDDATLFGGHSRTRSCKG